MHRHLTLAEYGQFVGVRGGCLVVRGNGDEKEYPLNRLKSIQIAKRGVSLSADAMLQCAARGIRLFICDYRQQAVACLSSAHQHAVVAVRREQFRAVEQPDARAVAIGIVHGKLRNQRATLRYFGKYHRQHTEPISVTAEHLDGLARRAREHSSTRSTHWRERLLGFEGKGAALYWQCLRETGLLPSSFPGRTGRKAADAANMALNYGYAILSTYIWNAILNAGLEPHAGVYHCPRPGKPSLVLDLMEEYRPWVVDRAVIKLRGALQDERRLDATLRKRLVADIHRCFASRHPYHGRRMRLESILQRQVYRLAGCFVDGRRYRPYLFKW